MPVAGTDKTVADLKEADFNYAAPLDMTNISVNWDTKFLEDYWRTGSYLSCSMTTHVRLCHQRSRGLVLISLRMKERHCVTHVQKSHLKMIAMSVILAR